MSNVIGRCILLGFYIVCTLFVPAQCIQEPIKNVVVINENCSQNHVSIQQSLIVTTLYGTFTVTEPVLIDLFSSAAMQRIKEIEQYGMAVYANGHGKGYTRYKHSVGVWALLRLFGASLHEQIAGLLHDVSHTVFSHVGDYLFAHLSEKCAYQDDIHEWYLTKQGVDKILAKYNITLADVNPKCGTYLMLEQDSPTICADRLEYNLHAGILTGLLEQSDIKRIVDDIRYDDGKWYFLTVKTAVEFATIPLLNTLFVWGGPTNYVINSYGADLLRRAMELKIITLDDIHFSTDTVVWQKLNQSQDPQIIKDLGNLLNYKAMYEVSDKASADLVIKSKCRGINPWVKTTKGFERLTDVDASFKEMYVKVKAKTAQGWPIRFKAGILADDDEKRRVFCLERSP